MTSFCLPNKAKKRWAVGSRGSLRTRGRPCAGRGLARSHCTRPPPTVRRSASRTAACLDAAGRGVGAFPKQRGVFTGCCTSQLNHNRTGSLKETRQAEGLVLNPPPNPKEVAQNPILQGSHMHLCTASKLRLSHKFICQQRAALWQQILPPLRLIT